MLRRETSHSYENKIGTTKFIVESECPENSQEDMMDAIVSLVKRDLENLSFELEDLVELDKPVDNSQGKIIPFQNKTR